MVLVVFLLYFATEKLWAVQRFTSGDLPRGSAAADIKDQKGKQSFEQRLVAQYISCRQKNPVIKGKNPSFCLVQGVSGKPVLNIFDDSSYFLRVI